MTRKVIFALVLTMAASGAAIALGSAYAGGAAGLKPLKGVHFAVVGSDGTLFKHSKGAGFAEGPFTGSRYQINMTGIATGCAITAVQGGTESVPPPPVTSGQVTVGWNGPTAVNVRTFDAAGVAANRAFHLILAC